MRTALDGLGSATENLGRRHLFSIIHIVTPADLRDGADKLAADATGKGTGKVKGRVAKPAP